MMGEQRAPEGFDSWNERITFMHDEAEKKHMKEVGKRVRARRLELSLTQHEVGEQMGFRFGASWMSRIETGTRRLTTFQLVMLCGILDLNIRKAV